MWLDSSARKCQSYALDITNQITGFMFREKVSRRPPNKKANLSAHNFLVDCHSDVRTLFPVLAAVERETISSATSRSHRTLVLVTDSNFDMFAPRFSDMIYAFEPTKNPTGDVPKSIKASAASFRVFMQELCSAKPWSISQYRVGGWMMTPCA